MYTSGVNSYTCVCNWGKEHVAVIERWPNSEAWNREVPLYF